MPTHSSAGARPEPDDRSAVTRLWDRLAAAWWPWLEPDVLARLLRRAAALTAVGTVAGVWVVVAAGTALDLDDRAISAVAEGRDDTLVQVLDGAGRVAGFASVLVLGALATLVSRLRTGTWRMGQLLVVAVCGALAIIGTVKLVIPRDRPDAALFEAFSSAFPSGHAARAVVVFGLASWIVTRRRSLPARRIAWFAAAAGALVVAGSRVYSGMHWPTDVLVGLAVGAGWLSVVLAVADEKQVVVRRHGPAPTLPRADATPTRG